MKYLILSGGTFEEYEYKRLLELLPERSEVYFAGRMSSEEQHSSQIQAIPLAAIASLEAKEFTVIVSSPYWLSEILSLQARYVVALLEHCPEEENKNLWDKYSSLLGAMADLVGTRSERIYLEQSLHRERVLYLAGDQQESYGVAYRGGRLYFLADYEVLWREALSSLWVKQTVHSSDWNTIQLKLRAEYYISMCIKLPSQPVVHYLAASYLYLLGDLEAKRYLTHSLELMVLHDYLDCLQSHFRFFSAIEAKLGDLETAVQQYVITAITAEEKQVAARMQNWLHSGEHELVRAELFRENEDEAAAIQLLRTLSSTAAKELLLCNYIRTFQWERALELQYELEGYVDGTMEGTLHLLHGRRHEAIRSFLNAVAHNHEAWPLLSEMVDLEEAGKRMRRRVGE